MPYVKGFLKIVTRGHPDQGLPGGEGPVDPDYGIDIGHRPDQGLPPVEGPVDPGFGWPLPPVIDNSLPPVEPTYPVDPGWGLPAPPSVWPKPPVGIWPPPVPIYPSHPIYPTRPPGRPDQGLPRPPGSPDQGLPPGPDQGLPPSSGGTPPAPDQGLPPHVDHELPEVLPPGSVWPPLPPEIKGQILCFVWIVGVGYRWTVIDPSLTPDQGLPGGGAHPGHPIAPGGRPSRPIAPGGRPPGPDQGLPPTPPTAQPKR